MEIKEIKNLVFEGGGGKGAIYVGAIEALEVELAKEGQALISEKGPIKGIGGSSAGAITAFVLSLGLKSNDLNDIIKNYPFKNFLSSSQEHVGKYRMVANGKDGKPEILIGSDAGFNNKGAGFFANQKMGYKNERYSFSKRPNSVGGEFAKKSIRNFFMESIFIVIITGITKVTGAIGGFFSKIIAYLSKDSASLKEVTDFLTQDFFKGLEAFKKNDNVLIKSASMASLGFFKRKIKLSLIELLLGRSSDKIDLNTTTLTNIIFENGMLSGFEVREFFFDCILYALKKPDSFFHIQFVKHYESRFLNLKDKINKIQSRLDGNRKERIFSGDLEFDNFLKKELPLLTFMDFYKINGIDIKICVTNLTQETPNYFSYEYTPDFPILEAIGASMSIPPAIKPVYNEADVIKRNISNFDKKNFDLKKAAVLEAVVRKYQKERPISLNNATVSFIPLLLCSISNKDKFDNYKFNGKIMDISVDDIHQVYNSIYKGMLIDGGVLNNIPYNLFREESGGINTTLALKLDGIFPDSFLLPLIDKVEIKLNKLSAIIERTKQSPTTKTNVDNTDLNKLLSLKHATQKSIEIYIEVEFKRKYPNASLNKESLNRIKEIIVKKVKERAEGGYNPWNKRKSIFSLISTFMYNAEGGQIQRFSDHKNIIPIYSFGIDTYDFDTNAIDDLVEFSKNEAKKQVNDSLTYLKTQQK